jgi:hypothetical protein
MARHPSFVRALILLLTVATPISSRVALFMWTTSIPATCLPAD